MDDEQATTTQSDSPEAMDDRHSMPTPETRAREGASGIPVVMGDGQTWVFARCGLAADITQLRDDIYTSLMLRDAVSAPDVLAAAWYALAVNYDLTGDELRGLLAITEPEAILGPAIESIIPLPPPQMQADFTEWAWAALAARGLKPSEIPEDKLPWVLAMLVATGVPSHEEFTAAGTAAAQSRKFKALAAGAGARLRTE